MIVPLALRRGHGWRALILLFAGLLTLGFLQPLTATAAAPAQLRVKDRTVVEADSGSTNAHVKIVLSKRVNHRVSVAYTTKDGTAEADSDYLESSGRVTFPKRSKVAFVHVPVLGDTNEEPDEFFKVRIFDAVHAKIADRVGKVTILDEDETAPPPEPKLYVGDVDVDEGDAAYFKVTLSKSAPEDVTFDYATSDGSAKAGSDYDAASYNNYKIPKGSSSASIKVTTREDSTDEPDETFYLNVSDLDGVTAGDLTGKATIEDDDPAPAPKPTLTVEDEWVDEGDAAYFTVKLSSNAPNDVTFDYETGDGSAVAGKDYDAASYNNYKIPKGSSSASIKVMTREDDTDEPDETFYLKVSDLNGATAGDLTGKATIKDDDPAAKPKLYVDDTSVNEGDQATFKVRLSFKAPSDVYFDFDTENGSAKAGEDYDTTSGNNVKIAKGEDSTTVKVWTREDSSDEPDETFKLRISDVTGATGGDYTATGTIKDDDPAAKPELYVDDTTVNEGGMAYFKVRLSFDAPSDVYFDFDTANGTAEAGKDYDAKSVDNVKIAKGDDTVTLEVKIRQDDFDEGDETFKLKISDVTGATEGDYTAVATIKDDE
ncbi:MAG TPA: Calx-beta domain-containing protein [Nocardioidaceae bacterium]|nr:Calx-beta domain-containing protein [Nocardioidaceae bacterium]